MGWQRGQYRESSGPGVRVNWQGSYKKKERETVSQGLVTGERGERKGNLKKGEGEEGGGCPVKNCSSQSSVDESVLINLA